MSASYYVPDSFKVGLYSQLASAKGELNLQELQFGFPSCRWLGSKQWTESSKFAQLCDGYKPSEQRNDPKKEIEKALGLHVKDIKNEWTSGFKFFHVGPAYGNSSKKYAYIRDPRGFCISIEDTQFFNLLNYTDIAIGSDGTMSGKFKYAWSNGKWSGLERSGSKNELITDEDLQARASRMTSGKDLQPGDICDVMSSLMYNSAVELVYVGNYELPSREQLAKVLYRYFTNCELGRLSRLTSFGDAPENMLPWNNEIYVDKMRRLCSSVDNVPVFVSLDNKLVMHTSNIVKDSCIEQYDLHNAINTLKTADMTSGNAVSHIVNLYPFCYHDLFQDSITWSKTILKHIAGKSPRQLDDHLGTLDVYNTYSFSQIKQAVDKIARRVSKTLDVMKKLLPFEKMETSSAEYSKWTAQLRSLRFNTGSFFAEELVSLKDV